MPNPSNVIRKTAENVIHLGTPPTFAKAIYIEEIRKRADEIRTDGESDAQAFVRAITSDPVGTVLYKASKFASGPEIEGDAAQDDVKPMQFADYGPAHQEIESLARDHKLRNPSRSMEQARATVMNARRDLSEKAKNEHFAHLTNSAAMTPDDLTKRGLIAFRR